MRADTLPRRIKKTRWFTSLFIWWVIAVFFYLFVAANQNRTSERVMASGIQTVLAIAERGGLPLLERDVQALTRLTQEMANKAGVISVSIIDHKNKIIAFTNPERLLATPSASVNHRDGVRYWHQPLADGVAAICFSSDISFGGTKIGEVLLARDAQESGGLTTIFFLACMVSLLLIVFVLLIIDFQGVRPLKAVVMERLHAWLGGAAELPEGRDVICPVCGHHKPLNRAFMLQANLDRYPVVRPVGTNTDDTPLLFTKGINLREISRREDLGWLRRQMIHRCADIIKKLAGE